MKKVVVGMSGGVDSAVAAFLLKEKKYEVVGLFMRNWDSNLNDDIKGNPNIKSDNCEQDKDLEDAKAVCKSLDIPFFEVNFVKEYWDLVFSYFLDELKRGRTPNPDIMCNKYIKFDLFIKEAEKLGANFIATGHYARIEDGILKRGKDNNKDQTYFLTQINKKQLDNVIFPIGDLNKEEVRKIAEAQNIPVSAKKDSTGICFIGERNFKPFLQNYLPNIPGKIINIDNNEELGSHEGLMYYTIGQRKGLNISAEAPLFVVGKNLEKNYLLVAKNKNNKHLMSNSAKITDINWFGKDKVVSCSAKFRYRQKDNDVTIKWLHETEAIVSYIEPIKAVTPGQACVFYLGEECLGGGIIYEVYNKEHKKIVFYE